MWLLPPPGTADQYDVVGTVYKISAMELTDKGFIHLAGCKVEPSKILVGWYRKSKAWV